MHTNAMIGCFVFQLIFTIHLKVIERFSTSAQTCCTNVLVHYTGGFMNGWELVPWSKYRQGMDLIIFIFSWNDTHQKGVYISPGIDPLTFCPFS